MLNFRNFFALIGSTFSQSNKRNVRKGRRTIQSSVADIESLEPRQLMTGVGAPTPSVPHFFYVDPMHGSSHGDGSSAHPWQTLQQVVNSHLINGQDTTKGVVHAGDTIYLMSGDQGSVSLTNYTGQFNNTSSITVQAYPGQTPVIDQLLLQNGSNWVFRGITFTEPATVRQYSYIVRFENANNIVFDHNTVYSTADVSHWAPKDWASSSAWVGIGFNGTNATITNNTISNIQRGAILSGNQINFSCNTIDDFADDALDFTSSNTLIQHNTISNHYGLLNDGNHNDGIQGWTVGGLVTSNVTIDGNVVIASNGKDANIPAVPTGIGQDTLQGISIFDGLWNNVKVTNNVVAIADYHGIAMYGVSGLLIANNTVVRDSSNSAFTTWITVQPSKAGATAKSVIVRNNIANMFLLPSGVIDDHNISLSKNNSWSKSVGDVVVSDPTKLFVAYNLQIGRLDLRLAGQSPAIGAGTSVGAVYLDALGRVRNQLIIDVGAYSFTA